MYTIDEELRKMSRNGEKPMETDAAKVRLSVRSSVFIGKNSE